MTQLDRSALNARNRLLMMFMALCILDIALVWLAQDRWAIARIGLTIIVMYFVMQGRKWAKWTLISLCSLLVMALLAMIVALGAKLSAVLIIGSLIMAVLSTIIPIYLIQSKDLNRYFCYQRQSVA